MVLHISSGPLTDIQLTLAALPLIWDGANLGVASFRVNPRFHPVEVGWNLELIQKLPATEVIFPLQNILTVTSAPDAHYWNCIGIFRCSSNIPKILAYSGLCDERGKLGWDNPCSFQILQYWCVVESGLKIEKLQLQLISLLVFFIGGQLASAV